MPGQLLPQGLRVVPPCSPCRAVLDRSVYGFATPEEQRAASPGYDFGDDWQHQVSVESSIANVGDAILCTGGAPACPPDDCGGPLGYANLLRVPADPNDEEHQILKRWVGKRFAPEQFELEPVNERLATLLRQLRRRR